MTPFLSGDNFWFLDLSDWGQLSCCSKETLAAWDSSFRYQASSRAIDLGELGTLHHALDQVHHQDIFQILGLHKKRIEFLLRIPIALIGSCFRRAHGQAFTELFWSLLWQPFVVCLDIYWSDLEHLDRATANTFVEQNIIMGRMHISLRCSFLQLRLELPKDVTLGSRRPRNRAEALWAHVAANLDRFAGPLGDLFTNRSMRHYGKLHSLLLPKDSCNAMSHSTACLNWLITELGVDEEDSMDDQLLFCPAPEGFGQWDPVLFFTVASPQLEDKRWFRLIELHLGGLEYLFQSA
jgi:hypothetical protein